MGSIRRLPAVAVVALVAAAAISYGCAAMKQAQRRSAYIDQETRNFVYDKSCQQVWPDAREMLFREGYSVKDTGEGAQMTVETEWKRADEEYGRTEATRYLVQGTTPEEGKCEVRFTRNERDEDGDLESDRDLEMEWKLIQRAAPEQARQIQSDAQSSAGAAAN